MTLCPSDFPSKIVLLAAHVLDLACLRHLPLHLVCVPRHLSRLTSSWGDSTHLLLLCSGSRWSSLEPLDSFKDLDPVESDFDIQIALEILVGDEVEHRAVQGQLLEIGFILWQPQAFLKPKNGILS